MTARTTLYRLYAEDGALLYVGISGKWLSRMGQHATQKGWWQDVAMVKRETFPSRAEALAAEAATIREEQPLHNVQGRKPAPTPRVVRPVAPLPLEVFEISEAIRAEIEEVQRLPPLGPDDDLLVIEARYQTVKALQQRARAGRKRVAVLAHEAGWSMTDIGAAWGVSRARVGQLLSRRAR